MLVDLGVEVRPLHVKEAQLCPLLGRSVAVRYPGAGAGHGALPAIHFRVIQCAAVSQCDRDDVAHGAVF